MALFGNTLRLAPPIFYVSPDQSITISARDGDDNVTLLRRVPTRSATSPPIPAPYHLEPLIRLLGNDPGKNRHDVITGLGLSYAAVVRALYHLCQDQSINASFKLEQPNAAEMFGPPRPVGRRESEL